ncbi:acyl-ACP--UDP-N-acetylglucosamine O-acyltransferase [Marinilabiliaceae bacterium ANBcel2]|nr:acyl-ACP--UDP-N-acetylglucosamine O-acyltransferase [Marinilabiliaceae bacterium ANBcel2]
MEELISNKAEIHPDAVIGKNVVIEAFAKIDKDVVIGEGTWIGANATIYPGARIGSNCKVFPGAVIAAIPQDLKFKGEYSTVKIGDNTTIREYVTINRGTASKGVTKVGKNSLLMAYSHLGHDTEVGDNCVIANSVQVAGEVVIEDWAVIGGSSAIHQFCRVGAHAMVSGMSGILSDVAPYTKVFGVPANYMGINSVGLKRRGFTREQIEIIHDVYRAIYQSGMNNSQAIEHVELCVEPSAEKEQIVEFVKGSKRGIIKGATRTANVAAGA